MNSSRRRHPRRSRAALVAALTIAATVAAVLVHGAATVHSAVQGSRSTAIGLYTPKIDTFECYQMVPHTFVAQKVVLTDQFITNRPAVVVPPKVVGQKSDTICNPANVKQQGILHPQDHLACYWLNKLTGWKEHQVQVTNEFGTQKLFVDAPQELCAPTGKSLKAPAPAVPPGLDHYLCYIVKEGSELSTGSVSLADEFLPKKPISTTVGAPERLCTPVQKQRGTAVFKRIDLTDHLVCYQMTPRAVKRIVWIRNQFEFKKKSGFEHVATIARMLCVPSLKKVIG